jgi:regulator of protease activity HflC (stomatin/prohibitin superfamily)
MANRFDDEGPDIKVVVAQYRDAMRKRWRWVVPLFGAVIVLILIVLGVYSIEPGEVGVVRTFGKETAHTEPGLHFVVPFVQRVDKVNVSRINREEIGFRTTPEGPKRVDSEALMLTGDENIIEALMIVQFQVADPSKYLFKLKDPEATLRIAAEVALRGVVGQMRITSSVEELAPSEKPEVKAILEEELPEEEETEEKKEGEEGDTPPEPKPEPKKPEAKKAEPKPQAPDGTDAVEADPTTDILTTGREYAQVQIKEKLQELMDLYESGIRITEVKLQGVDAPDEVKDAFHDVVRAREERAQLINKALSYREDRLPKARGEKQKVLRAAEAYKQERVLRAQGEVARFSAILKEYDQAKGVTRQRLHLEALERILKRVPRKVVIDESVAKNALPFLNLGDGAAPLKGGQ